ncbi:MAG TPA: hypothetical protein VMI54_25170 [Polyangiaceae bacterium]|nr:hypothetical protein [Polyangiaceae bacterium]
MPSLHDRLIALREHQVQTADAFIDRAVQIQGRLRDALIEVLGCPPQAVQWVRFSVEDKKIERQAGEYGLLTEAGFCSLLRLGLSMGRYVDIPIWLIPNGKSFTIRSGKRVFEQGDDVKGWAQFEAASLESYLTVSGLDAMITARVEGVEVPENDADLTLGEEHEKGEPPTAKGSPPT